MDAYMYTAALLCEDCGEKRRQELAAAGKSPDDPEDEYTYDSDDFPKGPYPQGGGEADTPNHCDSCGTFLENPLTDYGDKNVAEALENYVAADDVELDRSEISRLVCDRIRDDGNPTADVLCAWAKHYDYVLEDVAAGKAREANAAPGA